MNQLNDISNNININNNNKWFLMLCELQFPHIHGQSSETHYLVYDRFHGPTGISFQDLDNVNFDYETDEEYESDDDIDDGIVHTAVMPITMMMPMPMLNFAVA